MTTTPNMSFTHVEDAAKQFTMLNTSEMLVGGDLKVDGSISPGTFTNRVVTLTSIVLPLADHLLTTEQSGTTFIALNDYYCWRYQTVINLPAPSVAVVGFNL